jgi:phage terminase large subunit-like protein
MSLYKRVDFATLLAELESWSCLARPNQLAPPGEDWFCWLLLAGRGFEDNLILGLRMGERPLCAVATTPRPTKLIRDLVGREGADVVVTRGTSYENRTNLAPQFFDTITKEYEGTRLGRQELMGELLLDVPGALWVRGRLG